jgi:hypothetical protein
MTRKGQYLLSRRTALQRDSWTYGDWGQYLAFRDNGEACCVRHALLPIYCAIAGLILLWFPALAIACAVQGMAVSWNSIAGVAFAAFLLLGPEVVLSFTDWRLVVVVLTCTRKGDGTWERDL